MPDTRSRFYESLQQRYANVATVTWLARNFETVKFPITSSPRARPSNWANAELYRYKIVAVSLHKTHICVVKSLVKIAAVSWHSLRRFIKPAPDEYNIFDHNFYYQKYTSRSEANNLIANHQSNQQIRHIIVCCVTLYLCIYIIMLILIVLRVWK